jgi:hypothetical protein
VTIRERIVALVAVAGREALGGARLVLHRPVLIAVEAWPAILASALAAQYRREVIGRRDIDEIESGLLIPVAAGWSLALTLAYVCMAIFGVILTGDRTLSLRGAWELTRPRLWLLGLCATAVAILQTVATATAAGRSRTDYALVNGAVVAAQLTLLYSVPLTIVRARPTRREPIVMKWTRWLLTAAVGLGMSAFTLFLSEFGRLLTSTSLLWWLGALTVLAAIVLNVLAIAVLRAVRYSATFGAGDG